MKALVSGVGVAVVAGVLMGAAMKPNLEGDDRPAGPQMFAGGSGHRSTGPFDDGAGYGGYTGQVPDYVVGTDWRKSLSPSYQVAEAAPAARRLAVKEDAAPVALKWAAMDQTPAPPVTYPSLAGGQPYGADRPAPPLEDAPAADPDPAAG